MKMLKGGIWRRAAAYAASKFAAAGTVFLGFLVLTTGLDPVAMSELTRELPLWGYSYGYAVLFAAVADLALLRLKGSPAKAALTVLLHILGGILPFAFWFPGQWLWVLFAGFYGTACSLAFLAVSRLFRRRWPYSGVASVLLLALALYVTNTDFTETKHWTEASNGDGYRAEFVYFHGKKEIPVQLGAGQTLSYRIDWQIASGGGYGTYLDGESGTYISDANAGGDWIGYRADKPSTVRIVVTGKRAQGAFTIRWRITQ